MVADYTPLRRSADPLIALRSSVRRRNLKLRLTTAPAHHSRCTLNSEVFRVFQVKAQDFQGFTCVSCSLHWIMPTCWKTTA